MATGIVSIAAHLPGLPLVAFGLFVAEHRVLRRPVGADRCARAFAIAIA